MVLHFTVFNVEANFDHVYVYDGPDTDSPEVADLDGSHIPDDILSTGAFLTVRFDCDASVNYAGFEATVSLSPHKVQENVTMDISVTSGKIYVNAMQLYLIFL